MDTQTVLSTIGIVALIANAVILLAVFIVILVVFNFLRKTKREAEAAVEVGQHILRTASRNLSIAGIAARVIQSFRGKKSSSSNEA